MKVLAINGSARRNSNAGVPADHHYLGFYRNDLSGGRVFYRQQKAPGL